MPETVKEPSNSENKLVQQKVYRPGQRQQERLQRLARRRKRQRIVTASITAVLIITLGITGLVWFQNDTAQKAAIASAHITATANVRANATGTAGAYTTATANVYAQATTIVLAKNCFLNPDGPAVPPIYSATATPSAGPANSPALSGDPVTSDDGLKYVDIKAGTGQAIASGNTADVEYTGWLASTCQKFDSSYDHGGKPFPVTVGQHQVIQGWDKGLVGMQAGGIRRLYIPAALAYGSQGQGPIPPNADLIFDVTVLSVK
jgi:hypothetical protein